MKTLVEYLGSRLIPVDVLYVVETINEVNLAYKNVVLSLEKAGIRTIPLSETLLRLKNGSRIIFRPANLAMPSLVPDFLILDGFINAEEFTPMLKPSCKDNLIYVGGGMSQIRDYAKKQAYKRFV